ATPTTAATAAPSCARPTRRSTAPRPPAATPSPSRSDADDRLSHSWQNAKTARAGRNPCAPVHRRKGGARTQGAVHGLRRRGKRGGRLRRRPTFHSHYPRSRVNTARHVRLLPDNIRTYALTGARTRRDDRSMITRLTAADGERVFDGEIGRFVEA